MKKLKIVAQEKEVSQARIRSIIGTLAVVLAMVSLLSCAISSLDPVKRFQGHWTAGEAFSYFTLIDGSNTYWMVDKGLAPEASRFIDVQPSHPDPFHSGGDCQAIYLDVLGRVEENKTSSPEMKSNLHISRILRMEPAHAEFFKSSLHPLPEKKE